MTAYLDLLAPYSDFIAANPDTVAVAILRAEARHIGHVRAEQGRPFGGWKNELPLENSTNTGWLAFGARTGDFSYLRKQRDTHHDIEIRKEADTLLNCTNVYDRKAPRNASTQQLIQFAATELYFYGELS